MADSITLEAVGLDRFRVMSRRTKSIIEGRNLYANMTAAAGIVERELKRRAPSGPTGRLKRSPVVKGFKPTSSTPAVVFAALDRGKAKGAPHAHFVIEGTSRGVIPNPFFSQSVEAKRAEVARTLTKTTALDVHRAWEKK